MAAELPLAFGATVGLLTLRIGAALRMVPFFGGTPMPIIPWTGLSITLAALLAPQVGPAIEIESGNFVFVALALKEIFIGFVIGTMVRMAFLVFEIVGELARISALAIPSERQTGVFSKLYILLGVVVFLLVDGHHALIQGLVATVRCIPPHTIPGTLPLTGSITENVIALFSTAMATGVLAAGPIFAAGIASDLIVGSASRFYHGVAETGTQAFRPLAVQLAVVASMVLVVSTATEFLQMGLQNIALCGK